MMKHYLLLALAALAFFVVAPSASAVRVRVVDAPSVDCTALPSNSICSVTDVHASYELRFMPVSNANCQSAAGQPDPGADISGFTWCIIFNNSSGAPLTTFNFTFTVPAQGINDDYSSIFCDGFPTSVTNDSCPEVPLQAGAIISAAFSASPGVPNGQAAYLFVDFQNNPGTTDATFAAVSVPEPGALGLFGLGLLAIGMGFGWEKRRQNRATHYAA